MPFGCTQILCICFSSVKQYIRISPYHRFESFHKLGNTGYCSADMHSTQSINRSPSFSNIFFFGQRKCCAKVVQQYYRQCRSCRRYSNSILQLWRILSQYNPTSIVAFTCGPSIILPPAISEYNRNMRCTAVFLGRLDHELWRQLERLQF